MRLNSVNMWVYGLSGVQIKHSIALGIDAKLAEIPWDLFHFSRCCVIKSWRTLAHVFEHRVRLFSINVAQHHQRNIWLYFVTDECLDLLRSFKFLLHEGPGRKGDNFQAVLLVLLVHVCKLRVILSCKGSFRRHVDNNTELAILHHIAHRCDMTINIYELDVCPDGVLFLIPLVVILLE